MSKKQLDKISLDIEKIKQELQAFSVFRPGSLTRQYRNPKDKTRPFFSLSYTHHMKSKTEYVRSEWANEVMRQIRDYKRFRKLLERWIELGIKYSQLSMKLGRKDVVSSAKTKL